MYMNDVKFFGRSKEDMDALVLPFKTITDDVRKAFSLQQGNIVHMEGINSRKGKPTKAIKGSGCKNLGILQGDQTEQLRKEHISGVVAVLKSRLSGASIKRAIKARAVPAF